MKDISEPPWRVAQALDLDPQEREVAGLIVVTGPPRRATLIADCRNHTLSTVEQRANTTLCAKAPALAQALLEIEDAVGDLPKSRIAEQVYAIIAKALRSIDIKPRGDDA